MRCSTEPIRAWMRRGDNMPLPSRVDSHVDLDKSQVVLENCNGVLGRYRILASGRLRWD